MSFFLKKRMAVYGGLILATGLVGLARAADLPALEQSYETAYARTEGDLLVIGTGAVERRWRWTGTGLATVGLQNSLTGYAWPLTPKGGCDWSLPGVSSAEGVCETIRASESTDEGFTDPHLEVVLQIFYPDAGLRLQYVVWAYPRAEGVRTELRLKRVGQSAGRTDNEAGVGETVPLMVGGKRLNQIGYYADTQHRNRPETPILKEDDCAVAPPSGTNRWASLLDVRTGDEGVLFVKESHKCVNTPKGGANTGAFQWDPSGMRSTGLGWSLADVDETRFHRCWAHWVVLYHGGDDAMSLALKRWDRRRYPVDPARDLYVMANTWGSNGNQYAARESNVRAEIESQADLGIDVQQIDDGWQGLETLGTYWRPVARVEKGKKEAGGHPYDVYPDGWGPIRAFAAEKGVALGLWAAFKIPEDDLIWNADHGGFRYFKLDFARLMTMADVESLMDKVRRLILHTRQGVRVNWDVTEIAPRVGYFYGREYGNIYLENRKPDAPAQVVYVPWLVLRDAWQVARYLNLNKFQVTVQNVDRVDRARSDAWRYPHDYCVAQTLMGSPIFFQETRLYSETARQTIRPLVAEYKKQRAAMFAGYVFPIGEEPDNRAWSGFQDHDCATGNGYVTLFRQVENTVPEREVTLHFVAGRRIRLINLMKEESRTVDVAENGGVTFSIPQAPGFLYLRYEVLERATEK